MPVRSNAFQRFVRDLEALLAPKGASVEESGMVLDRSTGTEVEVDVVVRVPAGHRTVVIGIECRDHERPQDIAWIDALNSRKQNLEVDRYVAVSRSGFTKGAEEKAKQFGIDTIKMNAKKLVRWISFFAFLQFIQVEEQINPFFDAMKVRFLDEAKFRSLTVEETREAAVYGEDGQKIGSLAQFGDAVAQLPATVGLAERQLPPIGDFHFWAKCEVKPGHHLEHKGERHPLVELEIRFRAIRRVRTVPFNHLDYGNAQAVSSEFEFFNQGTMKMLLAQSEGGPPKMAVRWERRAQHGSGRARKKRRRK